MYKFFFGPETALMAGVDFAFGAWMGGAVVGPLGVALAETIVNRIMDLKKEKEDK